MPALAPAGCGGSKTCVFFARRGGLLLLICISQLYSTARLNPSPSCEASVSVIPSTSTCASGLLCLSWCTRARACAISTETSLSASAASRPLSPDGVLPSQNPAVPFFSFFAAVDPSPPASAALKFCPALSTDVAHVAVCATSSPRKSVRVNSNPRLLPSSFSPHHTPALQVRRFTLEARALNVSTLHSRVASLVSLTDPTSSFPSLRSPPISVELSSSSRSALPTLLYSSQSSPSFFSTSSGPEFISSVTEWSVLRTFLTKVSLTTFTTLWTLPPLICSLARTLFAAIGSRPSLSCALPCKYTVLSLGAAASSRLHASVALPLASSAPAETGVAHRSMKQQLSTGLVSTSVLRHSPPETGALLAPLTPVVSPSLPCRLYPFPLCRSRSTTPVTRPSAAGMSGARATVQLFSRIVSAISSLLPSPLYAAAHPQRRHAHLPPFPHNDASGQSSSSSPEGLDDDPLRTEGVGLLGSFLGTSTTGDEAASTSDGRTVLQVPPTIRPRRRVPGRRSSPDWQQLFPDLRLVDIALPATLHSALTDVNSVKYFELAVAQKVPVNRQLLDGIRMFDVRAWKDAQDGRWYSEVPWRLEDDLRQLREYAPTPEEASSSNFVSTMLRSLPPPLRPQGGKDRGRKGQQQGSDKRKGGAGGNGGGAGNKRIPAKLATLVDLHSWTTLEEGLFQPVQEFLRTHISEVAVVVISSFNGNRKTTMNAVPRGASLASSLQRLAARQQQRQEEGTAAGSSSARLEGHPFYEDFVYEAPLDSSASGGNPDRIPKQPQQPISSGNASIVQGSPPDSIPVLSPQATHNSPASLDSLGPSPAAFEVQDPLDTTSSFYMSSAVRKPLTYADVASFMTLVDTYWGQLLPRHRHVFFGPADDPPYSPPPATQTAQASPAGAFAGGAGTGVGPATAAPAGSLAHPVPPVDPASSGPVTSVPAPAVLQQASPPFVRRLLTTPTDVPTAPTAYQRVQSVEALEVSQKTAGRNSVGGAMARATATLETEALGIPEDTTQAGPTKHPAANVVTPVASRVRKAPARSVATADVRAAASRPPVPATEATAAAAARLPLLLAAASVETPVDTPLVAAGPGATAAVFTSGFDTSPDLYYAPDRRQLPAGRPPPSAAYRGPEPASGSTLPESGSGTSQNTRGASAEQSRVTAAANMASQINSYPMYESLHRPETFAEWLRAQGDLLLAKATLKDLIDAKIRLLLFVDDPLIAWYITVYSREHVVVFVAADHIYDVLYKSEALFGPCALPNRASGAPNSMLLSVTREATWSSCRERCESTPGVSARPEEGRPTNKKRQVRGRAAPAARDGTANSRSCTYWTFEPPVPLGNLPPVINNSDQGIYPPQSPAGIGRMPSRPVAESTQSSNRDPRGGGPQQDDGMISGAFATIAGGAPLEMPGECRTYTGPLALADTVPLHGSIIQPRSCSLRTLHELPTQWASAAVFADLTDAVCPIFEVPGSSAGTGDLSATNGLGDTGASDGREALHPKASRSYQFLPELCMLDATPRSMSDALQFQGAGDGVQAGEDTLHANLRRLRGMGLERKLLRVYFSPPSPVPFVDGTRGGRREVGPVDAVSLMNELTATWALWQLERQQLVGSLTVVEPIDPMGMVKEDGYAYGTSLPSSSPANAASRAAFGESGTGKGSTSTVTAGGGVDKGSRNDYYGGSGSPPFYLGRERPRSTRPVNALMVMRYDQTKSLIKNFSHLNYFEIVMNLNPQPRETRSFVFQGNDGADFSADRYVKVTAILNAFGLDDDPSVISGHLTAGVLEMDDTTEEERRAQVFMMWLAICAAIICFIVTVVGSAVRSILAKRVPRGGWTAAVTPRRASVAGEPS